MHKLTSWFIVLIGFVIGWVAWFPLRTWCFEQIPSTAQWAGIAKIAILVIIGWAGGIAIPLTFIIGGIYFAVILE